MTTFNTQQHSGNSLLGPSVPQSFIDTYILYKYLESSIAAKQAALEIRFNQTCDHKDENTEPDKWRAEFSLLAGQYDLDLIQEAIAAIIQHSSMRDYSNIPMRIPLTDNALKMVSNFLNQEFETVPFTKDMLTGNTYMPSIVGVHVQSNTALMGSVGAFATMDVVSIQKLKKQMMAAALILPDCFVQRDEPRRVCRRPFRLSYAAIAASSSIA